MMNINILVKACYQSGRRQKKKKSLSVYNYCKPRGGPSHYVYITFAFAWCLHVSACLTCLTQQKKKKKKKKKNIVRVVMRNVLK